MNQTKYNIRFGVKKYNKGTGHGNYIIGEYRLGKPPEQSNFQERVDITSTPKFCSAKTTELEEIRTHKPIQGSFDCTTYIRENEFCESVDIKRFNNNQDSGSRNEISETICKGTDSVFNSPISLRLVAENKSDLDITKPKVEEMSLAYEQREQNTKILKEIALKFYNNNNNCMVPSFSDITDLSYEDLSQMGNNDVLKLNNSDEDEGSYVIIGNTVGSIYITNNLTITHGHENVNCLGEN